MPPHVKHGYAIACALLFLAMPAMGKEGDTPEKPQETAAYTLDLTGAPEGLEKKDLLRYTEAAALADRPVPSLYFLQKRMDADAQTLKKALQAEGYYDATVRPDIATDKQPPAVTFVMEPGERYQLVSIQTLPEGESASSLPKIPPPRKLGFKLPQPLAYTDLLRGGEKLQAQIYEANCLRRVAVRPLLRVDTQTKRAEIVYFITAGPEAKFGKLTVEGLKEVKETYVERKLGWKEGECYKPSKTEKAQLSLLQSSLFARSDITVAEMPDENGLYGVTASMRERAHRTIKAGIGYASEEGFDFKPSWEHRNFFGEGEKLTVEGTFSTFLNEVAGTFERPAFLRDDQTLILKSNLTRADTDAYTSNKIGASATLERQLSQKLKGGLGVGYSVSQVDDGTTKEMYSLISVPAYLERNTRDDALDPSRGHVLRLDVEPLIDILNQGNMFLKSQASAKIYYRHHKWPGKPTWAARAHLGSINGSATGDIPADERFFAGGGGSVRGYGYQLLGPLSATNEPDGGRSIAEFSGELRLRVSDTIGIVPFMDAGNVYSQVYPDFGDMFYAAGLGLRYYSGFGPFRLDVAVPLDKRSGIDDSYQFYLSFGQAF